MLELAGGKRKTWLVDEAQIALPVKTAWAAKAASDLQAASDEAALLEALAPLIDPALFDGPQVAGSLVFQPTEERRRSGSHYTPRSLTRPIVAEALRPWLERCHHQPTAAQILDLKICDPAMGSGAFLVESCRYLAELLEQAWNREGLPEALKPGGQALGEDPLLYARRLIAQGCLYGVDKNPFAVNLARLSLWLVSLSKDAPFTFVDHALKCGDSLVGVSKREISQAIEAAYEQKELQEPTIRQARVRISGDFEAFHSDSRTDADDQRKREALQEMDDATAYQRCVGDLLVAAHLQGKNPKDRQELRRIYMEPTLKTTDAAELRQFFPGPLQQLYAGEKGIKPLHWDLVFPDVFDRNNPGFDVFVGNPPFVGGKRISESQGDNYHSWLAYLHTESNKNADLVAHFFRRCFQLVRSGGALGLIATNTIAQGETRSSGLRWICLNGGTIYAARKRNKWPGLAAVVVSVVHLLKGGYTGARLLERRPVDEITAFLFADGGHEDPVQLMTNAGKSFIGSYVLGMGFTFDDSGPADDDTPGIPSPIATMERLISQSPKNAEAIFPYIGGDEVNDTPAHAHHRYVVDFRDRCEEECRSNWGNLMDLLDKKVRPQRQEKKQGGEYKLRKPLPQKWWMHADKRPSLYRELTGRDRCIAISRVAIYFSFAIVKCGSVFSDRLVVFPRFSESEFSVLQSGVHDFWARNFMTTQGAVDAPTYFPGSCFETFPFPTALLDSTANEPTHEATRQSLEAIGERYHQFRAELMVANNEGLTSTYNRFHDPAETSSDLLELRRLHGEMDQAVLNAYGWSDVAPPGPLNSPCGFGLDYLDLEDDAQLPDELQERIDSGELFFWEADVACAFEAQVRAYGAVKGKKKLPWRYRWPEAVRDDVLARLLALNAERYAEEVVLGLHGKGGKQAGKASKPGGASGGKRRGRPAKASQVGETGDDHNEQMGLGL